MTTETTTWQEKVAKAPAYLSIGQTELYLDRMDYHDFPWELATSCDPGGSHRLEIATSVWFYSKGQPATNGMDLRWTFDIEPYTANGSGTYQIATAEILYILSQLTEPVRTSFKDYLRDCAEKVEARAREQLTYVEREFAAAGLLRAVTL